MNSLDGLMCVFQSLSVLMVAQNMVELLVGLKALPVATKVNMFFNDFLLDWPIDSLS